MNGKKDWWHAEIRPNPEHFKNDPRLTSETSKLITAFLDPKAVNKHTVATIILKITQDLEQHSLTNKVKLVPVESKKVEAASPQPTSIQPERADADSATRLPREAASKIYVILASNFWEPISSPIEGKLQTLRVNEQRAKDAVKAADVAAKQQNPKPYEKATDQLARAERAIQDYTKANQPWDLLRKRKNQAISIKYPKSWPHFKTTNGSPALTLRWALLGNTPSETNEVIGVWHTNEWSFMTVNWSLKISSTGAIYHAKQSGSIRADIAMSENADGADERLRLLLFTPDLSKPYRATVDGDSLIPSPEFQNFLNNLDLENNPLRIYGNYDNIKNPMDYNVKEIDKHGPWRLGIKRQLTAETERAETLESIKNSFDRLEAFWELVKKSTGTQLHENTFVEAVDGGKPKEAFWKQLNRLCVVAIYQRNDDKKKPQLEDKSEKNAREKIQEYMAESGDGGSKYQKQLQTLTEDLKHFKDFWEMESYKRKSYSAARESLSKDIQALRESGGKIVPDKLRVDLQFQVWGESWLTITRLDCRTNTPSGSEK